MEDGNFVDLHISLGQAVKLGLGLGCGLTLASLDVSLVVGLIIAFGGGLAALGSQM
jgi:hypothetical protein